jgi:hypothetical protein
MSLELTGTINLGPFRYDFATPTATLEPATLALVGGGLAAAFIRARKRRKPGWRIGLLMHT